MGFERRGNRMRGTFTVNALIVLVTAVVWVAAFEAHEMILPMTSHAAGIDLIFIPSGIRFFALLIGGLWAAIGVSFGTLLLAGSEFNIRSVADIVAIAAFSGVAPYASLLVSQRVVGIDQSLGNLFPRHLPLLAFGTAAGSSVLHNVLFWALGFETTDKLPSSILAMAAGDFLGSLMVVILVIGVMRLYRRVR